MVVTANSCEKALEELSKTGCLLLAGGTDLMVKRRNWSKLAPCFKESETILSIKDIKELQEAKVEDGFMKIGSLMTLESLLHHPNTPESLKKALSLMASPAIRYMGTIGGNIGNASPAGDTLPVLYALKAQVVLASIRQERRIGIDEFIEGPGKTGRHLDELIKEIWIPQESWDRYMYEKIGGRQADAISKLSFVGLAKIEQGKLVDIRMAFGAVGPKVVCVKSIENMVLSIYKKEKQFPDIKEIQKMYESYIKPIDDQRSTAEYRKEAALNLIEAWILEITEVMDAYER